MNFFASVGDDIPKNLYPLYNYNSFINTELLSFEGVRTEKIAFSIANKADVAFEQGKILDAHKMAYHALKLDRKSTDAIRVLARLTFKYGDGDTALCTLRELLNYCRPFYKKVFEAKAGDFYNVAFTRPYIRILNLIGFISRRFSRFLLQAQAYEEIVRLNNRDNTSSRDKLAGAYMTLVFKDSKGPRSIDQFRALIKSPLRPPCPDTMFGKESLEVSIRWIKIAAEYAAGGQWKTLLSNENKKSQWLTKYLMREISFIPEAEKKGHVANGYVMGDDMDDARKIYEYIEVASMQRPEFINDMHKFLRKPDEKFEERTREIAKERYPVYTEEELRKMLDENLDMGRNIMKKGDFSKAEKIFSKCRKILSDISYLSGSLRVLTMSDIPYAVFSNRMFCAMHLSHWNYHALL